MSDEVRSLLRGILVPIATPLTPDGVAVDHGLLAILTERLVGSGVTGLITCGSTGQGTALAIDERRAVTETVIEAAADRIPVLAHVGAMTTKDSVSLAEHARDAGAVGLMAVQPFYYQLSRAETLEYHRRLAEATPLPVIAYNFPAATGVRFTTDQIVELAARGYIASVKDSVGDALLLNELLMSHADDLVVLNGWDALALDAFVHGCPGMIWGLANAIPEVCVELYETVVVKGDLARAQTLWAELWPVCDFLASRGYVASVMAACGAAGLAVGSLRPPLLALDPAAKATLGDLIAAALVA